MQHVLRLRRIRDNRRIKTEKTLFGMFGARNNYGTTTNLYSDGMWTFVSRRTKSVTKQYIYLGKKKSH